MLSLFCLRNVDIKTELWNIRAEKLGKPFEIYVDSRTDGFCSWPETLQFKIPFWPTFSNPKMNAEALLYSPCKLYWAHTYNIW